MIFIYPYSFSFSIAIAIAKCLKKKSKESISYIFFIILKWLNSETEPEQNPAQRSCRGNAKWVLHSRLL